MNALLVAACLIWSALSEDDPSARDAREAAAAARRETRAAWAHRIELARQALATEGALLREETLSCQDLARSVERLAAAARSRLLDALVHALTLRWPRALEALRAAERLATRSAAERSALDDRTAALEARAATWTVAVEALRARAEAGPPG